LIITFACLFVLSAVGNAWGTRGKHFGWILLGAVAALAVAGY
jgi:ABC transporter substrate binding protein